MRPTIGSGHSFITAYIFASFAESRTFSSRVYATMRDIQLRSAPAQKFAPLPRRTTARAVERSRPSKSSMASAISSSLKALWTSGRFSVTVTTPSRSSTRSVLYGMRRAILFQRQPANHVVPRVGDDDRSVGCDLQPHRRVELRRRGVAVGEAADTELPRDGDELAIAADHAHGVVERVDDVDVAVRVDVDAAGRIEVRVVAAGDAWRASDRGDDAVARDAAGGGGVVVFVAGGGGVAGRFVERGGGAGAVGGGGWARGAGERLHRFPLRACL